MTHNFKISIPFKNKCIKTWFFIIAYCSISIANIAQNNALTFTSFTQSQGLSNNNITGITQDDKGFIWVGTLFGLNRFDGTTFTQFFKSTNNTNSICDNVIFNIKNLGNNQIGVLTKNGACILNTNTLQFNQLSFPTSDSIHYWSYSTKDIVKDTLGNFGLSTGTGFYIFNKKFEFIKRYEPFTTKEIIGGEIQFGKFIFTDVAGNMVQWNKNGFKLFNFLKNNFDDKLESKKMFNKILQKPFITILEVKKNVLLKLDVNNKKWILFDKNDNVLSTYTISDSVLLNITWYSSITPMGNGVYIINGKRGYYTFTINQATNTLNFNQVLQMPQHKLYRVFNDNNGRLWYGNTSGLFKQKLNISITNFEIKSDPSIGSFNINALATNATTIFGAVQNNILVINRTTQKFVKKINFEALYKNTNNFNFIFKKSVDTLWLCNSFGLCWLNIKNYTFGKVLDALKKPVLDSTNVNYIFKDIENNYWFSTLTENKIFKLDGSMNLVYYNKLVNNANLTGCLYSNYIVADKYANIWISADAAVRWNRKANALDSVIFKLPNQINFNKGFRVLIDNNGNYWVLVSSGGWYKIDEQLNFINIYSNQLVDVNIGRGNMINNHIFMNTVNNEIGVINCNTNKFTFLTKNDGLPNEEISTNFFLYDSTDKNIWFAAKNKILYFSDNAFENSLANYSIIITQVNIVNDTSFIYPTEDLVLTHNQNTLRINFCSINLDEVDNIDYYYRLANNNDTTWIKLNSPEILLTNLAQGTYMFQIKNAAKNNKWAAYTTAFTIKIKPPFWFTWWFILLIILITIYLIFKLIKWRENNLKIIATEKFKVQQANMQMLHINQKLAEAKLDALHSQMNPHFIFNCLATIKSLILNNQQESASKYLSKFAKIIRLTLNHSTLSFISIAQTNEYLMLYLQIESLRFSNSFDYEIICNSNIDINDIKIPPMIIQPLVENAIWHGLLKSSGVKKLAIQYSLLNNMVQCKVTDNGIGINAAGLTATTSHQSFALENIKKRLKLLQEKHKEAFELIIEDRNDLPFKTNGTIATITLPHII